MWNWKLPIKESHTVDQFEDRVINLFEALFASVCLRPRSKSQYRCTKLRLKCSNPNFRIVRDEAVEIFTSKKSEDSDCKKRSNTTALDRLCRRLRPARSTSSCIDAIDRDQGAYFQGYHTMGDQQAHHDCAKNAYGEYEYLEINKSITGNIDHTF